MIADDEVTSSNGYWCIYKRGGQRYIISFTQSANISTVLHNVD